MVSNGWKDAYKVVKQILMWRPTLLARHGALLRVISEGFEVFRQVRKLQEEGP